MTPTTVSRIEVHIVDSALPVNAYASLLQRINDRIGPWPRIGTLAQYEDAVTRAEFETLRIDELGDRYCRRFDHNGPGYARLAMRRETALAIAARRSERIDMLIGPVLGSA